MHYYGLSRGGEHHQASQKDPREPKGHRVRQALSVARGSAAQEAKEYVESASRDDRKRTAEDSGTLGGENAAKVQRCPICAIPAEANVVPHSCCIERMNKDFDAILTKPRNSMAEKRTNME